MPPDTQSTQRILLFQQAIHRFIAERRDAKLDARFGVAYAHRKSIAARLFLATHSHYNFSFIP